MQRNHMCTPAARSLWDLDDKAQEHMVTFLGYSGTASFRQSSRQARKLVNHQVKSVILSKLQASPVSTLRLPQRFPYLQKLTLRDSYLSGSDDACFDLTDLFHVLGGGHRWDILACLDILPCRLIDALALCVIAKAVPNLRSLTASLPYSPKAPAAAAKAIIQLSKLQRLELHINRETPDVPCLADELLPLTALTLLSALLLHNADWQVMRVVEKLQALISLELRYFDGAPDGEVQRLTSLANLQHFELTTYGHVECISLGTTLASMASLRSFISRGLLQLDGMVKVTMPAVTTATQLTSLFLDLQDSDSSGDDLTQTFQACLRMPNLDSLRLQSLETVLDSTALSVPAACADTLKHLHLAFGSYQLATMLLRSVAFRSFKLASLHLQLNIRVLYHPMIEDFCDSLVQALCSQQTLELLELNFDILKYGDPDPLPWLDDMWTQVGKHCVKLHHVDLCPGVLPLNGLGSISSLRSIHLHQYGEMEDVELMQLFPCRNLHSVSFDRCSKITAKSVVALAVMVPGLQKVWAYSCRQFEWDDELSPRPDLEVYVL